MSVVFYHFNNDWVPSGFVGVDVFFVISGYLMTGIIIEQRDSLKFSVIGFYKARFFRLVPALCFTCMGTLLLGWFFFTPAELINLAHNSITSLTFISNVFFAKQAGYFATNSGENWLLHTWSLSVEWQFYIIYPLVLMFLDKWSSKQYFKVMFACATFVLMSFSIYSGDRWPDLSYFYLPTRAWELMAGGVAWLYLRGWHVALSRNYAIVGMAIVISSMFAFSNENAWPGFGTIFPVCGTLLILVSSPLNTSLINARCMQLLGTWSYSIYLWHWPVVVLNKHFELGDWFIYPGILLSVILGWISFRLVETPFNEMRHAKVSDVRFWALPALFLGCLAFSFFVYTAKGLPQRLSEIGLSIFEYQDKSYNDYPSSLKNAIANTCDVRYDSYVETCTSITLEVSDVEVILIGDSHVESILPSVAISLSKMKGKDAEHIMNASAYGCIPFREFESRAKNRSRCQEFTDSVYNLLSRAYDNVPVVIISRINLYPLGFNEASEVERPYAFINGFKEFNDSYKDAFRRNLTLDLCELSKRRPVFWVKAIPEIGVDAHNYVLRKSMFGNKPDLYLSETNYQQRNSFTWSVIQGVQQSCDINILDPLRYLVSDKGFITELDGVPIYLDDNHLNSLGAEIISPTFDKIWSQE